MIIIGVSATCSSVAAPAGRDSKLSRQVAVNTITTVRNTNRDETSPIILHVMIKVATTTMFLHHLMFKVVTTTLF